MGFGPGAQMQQPLAIAVIGGLITNMLLTRLLIPVGYLVLKGGGGCWRKLGEVRVQGWEGGVGMRGKGTGKGRSKSKI